MSALRQRMLEDMRLRGLAERTQETYLAQVRFLAEYHGKSPDQLTEDDLRAYFLYLTIEKQVAASTFNIAINAIKFFYEQVLGRDWTLLGVVRPKHEKKLPVVLSREEVGRTPKASPACVNCSIGRVLPRFIRAGCACWKASSWKSATLTLTE